MAIPSHPLPNTDWLTGQFYQHLATGALRLQRCHTCGQHRHIPRVMCPSCHSDSWEWALCSGLGVLYSWTTTVRALHPAFTEVPFTIVTITLEEGPRLLGRLIGVRPEDVKAGLLVKTEFRLVAPDIALPQFSRRD